MPLCTECEISFSCITSLFHHLTLQHNSRQNDTFRCKESNCYRTFMSMTKFRKHLVTFHVIPIKSTQINRNLSQQKYIATEKLESLSTKLDSQDETNTEQPYNAKDNNNDNGNEGLHTVFFKYTAKLYADHRLPRIFVQETIESTKQLFEEILCILKKDIENEMKSSNIKHDLKRKILSKFDNTTLPFTNFATEHLRFKAFRESGFFIKAKEYIVGDRVDDKLNNGIIQKKIVEVTAQCIPMRETLGKFLSIPGVFKSVHNNYCNLMSNDKIITNFVQGKLWRNKVKSFSPHKIVLPLFLYFDDFEINNPLGSHSGIQKLGGLYFSIPCLPPEMNSLIENVFVAGLCHSQDRVVFKNHRIFHIFIDELNYLESKGIEIETEKGIQRVFFVLGLILGDNLGLNAVLGFSESFNANFYCRLCSLSKSEIQFESREKKMRLESYERDVMLNDAKKTGIKERSVWDGVQSFQSVENYAVCFLHDGFEGVLKYVMAQILHYYCSELKPTSQRLSIDVVNGRLKSFDYLHSNISNKPPIISEKELRSKHLSMSGAEMQNFVYIFAMIVGDLVPHDNVWQLYLQLRKITELCLAKKFQKECGSLMRVMVEEFILMLKEIFPRENVKPKLHNWTHYGTIMEEAGPIIDLSTSKFESKHKLKKKEASATTSRVNITYTLCLKETLGLCYRFLNKRGLEPNNDFGSIIEHFVCISHYIIYPLLKESVPPSFVGRPCLQVCWAQVNGQIYRKKSCVVIDVTKVLIL
ncbi:uncharacterized protein LOC118734989 [Rhagoletis pomonella]|uniref:uncharacterized protein LOC118734989 n=1 Tax=Rhagoletis pomonella TaxID=28610 RepID=UPI0017810384|nr:uncharacterized protein LOC118734989 [Rhagoletis pomonella]